MSIEGIRSKFAHPPMEARPEVRWWLAEGLHSDATLRREIADVQALGYGGVEFLAMDEAGVDHERYGWGSEEWTHDSEVVVREVTERGLAVSFTSGTNWANANLPTITPAHPAASKELNVAVEDLAAGTTRTGPLPRASFVDGPHAGETPDDQTLVAVVAVRISAVGADLPLQASTLIDLTAEARDDAMRWTAPDDGEWRLLVYWMHGTGQTAAPSASVNYTVNYVDPDGFAAVMNYWESTILTPGLRAILARNPRVQMYMDSMELRTYGRGGLFWGRTFVEEFRARRGYDVRRWLPFLTRSNELMASMATYHHEPADEDRTIVEKVRFDYAATLTDLYIENVLRPFRHFLNDRGIGLRAEISYGMPFELTRPGPEVDGVETESLEFGSQIDGYRLLSSAAHLFGALYSSETGATTMNHVLDHRFYDQIIATQMAAGVTKVVMHGWASRAGAEGSTAWPGHEGMWRMFSERFDTRQPGAEFYPLWTTAIARTQYVLRRGRPRIDVGILRSDHFTDNFIAFGRREDVERGETIEDFYGHRGMRARENFWWQDLGMQDAGWSYEFLDGSLLLHKSVSSDGTSVQNAGPGYQALIVYQDILDADVATRLLEWAQQGLPILFVDGATELKNLIRGEHHHHAHAASRTPGLDDRDDELERTIDALQALPNVARVATPADSLGALRALGVRGRAEFADENPDVLTHLRDDGEQMHLFAYHFRYEDASSTYAAMSLDAAGQVFRHDPWAGTLIPWPDVECVEGRTVVRTHLAPGETALFTLQRGATPSAPRAVITSREIAALPEWDVTVESWDSGADEVVREDRGLGYVTTEIRPTTAVENIVVGRRSLAPWLDLPNVGGHVSGVGRYRTHVDLDADALQSGRLILDLGSTGGALGSVSINGSDPIGFDTSHPRVEITHLVQTGQNHIDVRVSSSLNNRLLARGYYEELSDRGAFYLGCEKMIATSVRPHGLLGPVTIVSEVPGAE